MRRHLKSTIREVAERACVSPATVSYFASGREDKCSPETAERIREAINHYRYTPNSLSRSLRTRSTKTIGISVPRSSTVNRYGVRLWTGIDFETDAVGFSQIYYPAEVRHGPSVDSYLDGRIDGLIFAPSNPDDRPRQIAAANMPIVVISPFQDVVDGCGSVYADESQAVELAMSHLWSLGHRRIAHIVGPVFSSDSNPYAGQPSVSALIRRDRYTRWMKEHGGYSPDYAVPAMTWAKDDTALASIRACFARWAKSPEPPTAAFCANDALALAVIEVAREIGLDVPRDFSVVGIDNEIDGLLSNPQLTTVSIPEVEIGKQAVKTLFKVMQDAPAEECHVLVPVTDLIVRGSTRAL